MRRERSEWTARNTLVLPQVMHAAMPRWSGLKCARMAGDCSTVRRKQRISSPVQMLEMLAWAGCSCRETKRITTVLNRILSISYRKETICLCFLWQPNIKKGKMLYTHTHVQMKSNQSHVITAKLKINGEHHGLILSKLQSSLTMMARLRAQSSKDPWL